MLVESLYGAARGLKSISPHLRTFRANTTCPRAAALSRQSLVPPSHDRGFFHGMIAQNFFSFFPSVAAVLAGCRVAASGTRRGGALQRGGTEADCAAVGDGQYIPPVGGLYARHGVLRTGNPHYTVAKPWRNRKKSMISPRPIQNLFQYPPGNPHYTVGLVAIIYDFKTCQSQQYQQLTKNPIFGPQKVPKSSGILQ